MGRLLTVLFVACSTAILLEPAVVVAQPSVSDLKQQLRELKQKQRTFKERLEGTRDRKGKTKEKYIKTKKQENNLLELIDRYRELQRGSKRRLKALRRREERAKGRLKEITARFDRAENRLRDQKELLMDRLRSIYKQGQLMQARTFLTVSNFSEFITNFRYYRRLVQHDRNLIEKYRQAKNHIRTLRERRRRVYQRRKDIRERVQQTRKKRRELLESRKQFLEDVRNEKQLYRRRLRELEQQQQRLKEKVFAFQRRHSSKKQKLKRIEGKFGRRKGELPWPCESQKVLRPYGTRREKGIVYNNDGIDIACDAGDPVRAVNSGRVVFADEYRGIGKVVIVRHSRQYLTLYGSLRSTAISKDASVDEGTILGRVGQSPGMDRPRLYFQVFEGQNTLNPLEWLR